MQTLQAAACDLPSKYAQYVKTEKQTFAPTIHRPRRLQSADAYNKRTLTCMGIHIVETFNEEGSAVSTKNVSALELGCEEHCAR